MKAIAFRAAVAVLCCGAVANGASAAPPASTPVAEPKRVQVRNGNDLVFVIRELISAKRYDEARRLIAAWQPNDSTYRYRVRYVEGLVQRDQGDYEAAIETFRGILSEKPGFTFVRLDLAQTLYLARDDDAARHQAQLLIAAGVDDKVGGEMKSIVGAIDARRPIQFRAFASVLPSSNINSGTDKRVVTIGGLPFVVDDGSQRKSGVGILAGGDVLLRHQLNGELALVGTESLVLRMYPSIGVTNVTVNLSGGIERRIDRGLVTLSAIGEQDYNDMDAAFRSYGGRLGISRYVGEKGRVYGSLTLTERDFLDSSYMDGWRAEFSGFYDHFVSPSRFVRVIGGGIREDTKTDAFSFNELSGGLGFYNEFPMGFTLYAQAVYARRVYDAPMAVFGTRKDDRYEIQTTLTKRDFSFHGLAPQLTYTFTRNVSTSPFDDYTAHGLDVRLVKDF
jgi:hypothetical protein